MPPLNTALMSEMAKVKFIAGMSTLPIEWKQPKKEEDQYGDAFKVPEKQVPPTVPVAPELFRESSFNEYHVNTARKLGGQFADYIDGACSGIAGGVDMWRMQAMFKDLKIMAMCAIGAPGCLFGPDLENLIYPQCPLATERERTYSKAIAKGVAKQWKQWQDMVMVPGLPWYPPFAAFPGPVAPPMPNVPTPLVACPSSMMFEMTALRLKQAMVDALGESDALHHEELFDAIATGLALVFLMWLPMQMVLTVMGTGPVPTFAPPYVPVGPVINGTNIPTPGVHLSA
jgi:hypothetical protein